MIPKKILSEDVTLTPEILVPRLGDYLVETGKLSEAQLSQALIYQQEMSQKGTPVRLGQVLRTLGLIDDKTLDEAITVQILHLQSALQATNQELEQRVMQRTEELRIALDRLIDLNQVKANFIANISHELRTPLSLLKGYLEVIVDGAFGEIKTDHLKIIRAMISAEEKLEKLIDDLITFSYTEREQLSLNFSSVSLNPLIKTCISHMSLKARFANVTFQIDIPKKSPKVVCDREKITWVIDELINNAIKFSPNGGNVLIEAQPSDGFVWITIRDKGIGIPQERVPEIFEPFHQLDNSSMRSYGGTGLGLAMVNRIVEAHNSQMIVHSKIHEGSLFKFSLPISEKGESRE